MKRGSSLLGQRLWRKACAGQGKVPCRVVATAGVPLGSSAAVAASRDGCLIAASRTTTCQMHCRWQAVGSAALGTRCWSGFRWARRRAAAHGRYVQGRSSRHASKASWLRLGANCFFTTTGLPRSPPSPALDSPSRTREPGAHCTGPRCAAACAPLTAPGWARVTPVETAVCALVRPPHRFVRISYTL